MQIRMSEIFFKTPQLYEIVILQYKIEISNYRIDFI